MVRFLVIRKVIHLRLATLVLATALPALADPVLLRYKPSVGGVPYHLTTRFETSRNATKGDAAPAGAKLATDGGERVLQTVTADAAGSLSVQLTSLDHEVEVDGKAVEGLAFDSRPHTYRITDRGAPADDASRASLEAMLSPELPKDPVSVGHTWRLTVPATAQLPYELPVTHELEDVLMVDGERCAVIHTSATLGVKEPDIAIAVRVDSRLYLAIDSGQIVRANTALECNAKARNGFKSGGDTVKQRATRTLLRLPAGGGK